MMSCLAVFFEINFVVLKKMLLGGNSPTGFPFTVSTTYGINEDKLFHWEAHHIIRINGDIALDEEASEFPNAIRRSEHLKILE